MNAIYYAPILKIINERKALIDGNYAYTKTAGETAGALLDNREQRLLKTSKDAKNLITDKVNKTNAQAAALTGDAQKTSQEKIRKAKEKLANEEQKIASALDSKDLAKSISAKILGGAK
jgi:F-type H+-transporting ATPase subunit b